MTSSSLLLVLLHHLRLCWNYLLSLFHSAPANHRERSAISLTNLFFKTASRQQLLTFDNGTQVYIGDQIAEGGFSYVFEAFPASPTSSTSAATTNKKYALKRINCSDEELLQSCRHEAGIHRSLPRHHPNLLELLGLKFEQDRVLMNSNSSLTEEYNVCYMLFPHLTNSLRGEISRRNILLLDNHHHNSNNHHQQRRQPFTTIEALHLFRGILDGLLAMHKANISHRDVKLENVMLTSPSTTYADHHNTISSRFTPILIDYGSAGPLQSPPLTTRQSILQIIEVAESNTTFSYRPPELSDVGNYLRPSSTCTVDYGKVDVWSLGCVLFGILHGVSPFEMEFVKSCSGNGGSYGGGEVVMEDGYEQFGLVRIVECTTLKILGEVPFPPWAGSGLGDVVTTTTTVGDGRDGRYPLSLYKFIRYMVQHDRMSRPNVYEVVKRFGQLHYELLGEEWTPYSDGKSGRGDEEEEEGEHDDFDSLIASRDFV